MSEGKKISDFPLVGAATSMIECRKILSEYEMVETIKMLNLTMVTMVSELNQLASSMSEAAKVIEKAKEVLPGDENKKPN